MREIKLFDLNPETMTRGHVQEEYDPDSPRQRTGAFLIGIGPVIIGTLVFPAASPFSAWNRGVYRCLREGLAQQWTGLHGFAIRNGIHDPQGDLFGAQKDLLPRNAIGGASTFSVCFLEAVVLLQARWFSSQVDVSVSQVGIALVSATVMGTEIVNANSQW